MLRLQHGTTNRRADAIFINGPDIAFREPGGTAAEGFSVARAEGPFDVGSPKDYAIHKSRIFPNEGGPAIVEFELPDSVADEIIGGPGLLETGKALDAGFEIRFERRHGFELLLIQWPKLEKRVIELP